jgi:hypothetical protein
MFCYPSLAVVLKERVFLGRRKEWENRLQEEVWSPWDSCEGDSAWADLDLNWRSKNAISSRSGLMQWRQVKSPDENEAHATMQSRDECSTRAWAEITTQMVTERVSWDSRCHLRCWNREQKRRSWFLFVGEKNRTGGNVSQLAWLEEIARHKGIQRSQKRNRLSWITDHDCDLDRRERSRRE